MKNLNLIFKLLFFLFLIIPLTINADITITSPSLNEGNAGTTAFTFTVTATDVDKSSTVKYTTVDGTATVADNDYTAENSNFTFSGVGASQTQDITIDVTGDTKFEIDETFILNILNNSDDSLIVSGTGTILNDDNDLPVADAGADQTVTVGTDIILDGSGSTDSDGTITSYSWTDGITTWTGVSPTISGGLSVGTHTITLTVTDNDGDTDTDSCIITVAPKVPPIMGSIPDQTAVNGDPFSLALADYVTATDGDPIDSYSLSETPSSTGLSFNSATGLLDGTPLIAGTFVLETYATDVDGDSNIISFNLTVGGTAPIAVDDDVNTSKNVPVSIDILSNDTGGGIPVPSTVVITSSPNSGTVVLASGIVTYTPDTDYRGTDSFTYTVNNPDGIPSNVATVTIAVNAPIAVDDNNITTPLNIDVNITVTNNDTSADSTIDITTVTIIDSPTAGSVVVNPTTGVVTYTPQTDWFGNDTFTYTVDDANGITSNIATVTVSVISEQGCHDSATELLYATAYGDTATASNSVTSNDQVNYKVYLDIDGVLETNITNAGTEGLDFDFSKDCSSLLTVTRFGIADDENASLPLVLEAGWYYMAFTGEKSNAATAYSVTVTLLDPNVGGGTGQIAGGDADIVNNFTTTTAYNPPNNIHYITTKVAGDPSTSITGVYLDDTTGLARDYVDESGNGLWFMIIPYWSDSSCSTIDQVVTDTNGDPLVMQITANTPSVTATIQVPPKAVKDARFKITYLDLGAIYATTGDQCILNSATSGNLQGIGQCINSPAVHYEPNFGTPAYYRCVYGNGQPCLSSHHGYSCGPTDTTCPNYNELYDNEYGCLMCTLGANETCSNDNMSVRPESYSMYLDTPTPLLTSGQDYYMDANATYEGGGTAPTTGYTITLDNTNEKNASHIFNPEVSTTTCPPAGSSDGNFTMAFNNGVGTTLPPGLTYPNVGDVNITLVDGNWTTVDQKSPLECIAGSDSISSNPVGCLIKGVLQYRYIPGTFDIDATLEDHSSDDFTYLNDTHIDDSYNDMAALLDVNVSARALTGELLSHYITGCYAQDTDLTLTLNGMNITYPIPPTGEDALDQFLYYNTIDGEGNTSLPDATTSGGTGTITVPSLTIENSHLTFPENAPDGNGTASIEYKLNFDRKLNVAVNPFQIVLNELNITDDDGAEGNLSSITDQNATLLYARSRASKFFYEDVTTASITTPNIIDVYCDLGTNCLDYGVEIYSGAIDVKNWFISTDHANSDGNITLMVDTPLIEGTGSPSVNSATNPTPTDITTWTNGIDGTVTVATEGAAVPLTVPIKIVRESDTPAPASWSNEWLIYNPDSSISAPSPFYKVRFIGEGDWTGTGNTGDVVNIDASRKKSKRMDW